MEEKKADQLRYIGIALNLLMIAATIIVTSFDIIWIKLLIIALQIGAIGLDNLYQNSIDKFIFKEREKKALLMEADPDRYKNSIQGAREELRYGLNILLAVFLTCCLMLMISTKDIIKPGICVCLTFIAYVYADYIPHTKCYAQRYDRVGQKENEKGIASRGLAKIYREEYEQTQFNKKSPKYNEWKIYEYDKECEEQNECIKNILRLKIDSINNNSIVISYLVLFCNIIFIFPGVMEFIIQSLANNMDITNAIMSCTTLIINVVFFGVALISYSTYEKKSRKIEELANLIVGEDREKRFNKYKEVLEDNDKIRARGIFVFCSTYMDRGISLNSIDLRYRMLFTHRKMANVPRFNITVSLIAIILILVFIELRASWTMGITITAIFAVATIIFRVFLLEKIEKRQIIKQINKLKEQQASSLDLAIK